MDLREAQHLEGVTIIDPKASRNRQLIVAALGVVAVSVLGWIILGQPAHNAPAMPPAAVIPAPVGTDSPSRQVTGTIPDDASKPLAAIRLAAPPPAASAAAPAPSAPVDAKAASALGLKLDTEFASARRIVPFAFNRAGVGPLGKLAVKELAPLAKQAEKVNVRGRTDALGNSGANRKVALDRAQTVYNAFLREGVQKQKLRLTYCTTCFIASNDTDEGRRANRRVEVELIMPRDDIAKLPKPIYAPESPPLQVTPLAASEFLQPISR